MINDERKNVNEKENIISFELKIVAINKEILSL
jgi:hypothetical protein